MSKVLMAWKPDEWYYPKPKYASDLTADQIVVRTARLRGGVTIGCTANVPQWAASACIGACRRVWNSLPTPDRNEIVTYWLMRGKHGDIPYRGFTFVGSPIEAAGDHGLVDAMMDWNGHQIIICAGSPDFDHAVAHELAHVYCISTHHLTHKEDVLYEVAEKAADAVAERWGYKRL